MKGVLSFHPVALGFFDDVIAPLWEGRKINPEEYLRDALRIRHAWWQARKYSRGLEVLAESATAPEVSQDGSLWERVRTRLEKFDHRPDESAAMAARHFERDLHARGRPFFVTEGSADRVADAVERYLRAESDAETESLAREQLKRLDPALEGTVEPVDGPELTADLVHRNDLLKALKDIFDLARGRPVGATVAEELPWRAVCLHGRVHPFWIAEDVDGLETICRAAGVPAPDCLAPAWRLFAPAVESAPGLKDRLGLEIQGPRSVGALVMPGEINDLLQFLEDHGARIIQAAARAGEGPAATLLLKKIKECAVYASRHGLGYLEAAGVEPPDLAEPAAVP